MQAASLPEVWKPHEPKVQSPRCRFDICMAFFPGAQQVFYRFTKLQEVELHPCSPNAKVTKRVVKWLLSTWHMEAIALLLSDVDWCLSDQQLAQCVQLAAGFHRPSKSSPVTEKFTLPKMGFKLNCYVFPMALKFSGSFSSTYFLFSTEIAWKCWLWNSWPSEMWDGLNVIRCIGFLEACGHFFFFSSYINSLGVRERQGNDGEGVDKSVKILHFKKRNG